MLKFIFLNVSNYTEFIISESYSKIFYLSFLIVEFAIRSNKILKAKRGIKFNILRFWVRFLFTMHFASAFFVNEMLQKRSMSIIIIE